MASRHDDDRPRTIGDFDNWLEQSIRDAQVRGEFDNLPGEGKPQDLTVNHHAGDKESGFRILKNNDLAPAWIEADKQIRAEQEALEALAHRTATFIADHRELALACPANPSATTLSARLRRFWFGAPVEHRPDGTITFGMLVAERDRARREYLHRSDELNQTINEYNNSLPFDLLWRERQRVTAEQAAANFDATCPAIGP